MASYIPKAAVPIEVQGHSELDLNCKHQTSADFMQIAPVYYRHTLPNEKLSVDMMTFCRLAPLPVPTLGDITIHNRAFFVPYRTIWRGWNDFVSEVPHLAGDSLLATMADHAPILEAADLLSVFNDSEFSLPAVKADANLSWYDETNLGTWDFEFITSGGMAYKKLTYLGRHSLKVLESLGYKVFANATEAAKVHYNALGLLGFIKVYIDYYYPPQYRANALGNLLEGLCKQDSNTTYFSPSTLKQVFKAVFWVNYDADYFTSAFDTPTGPDFAFDTTLNIPDINKVPGAQISTTYGLNQVGYSGYVEDNVNPGVIYDQNIVSGTPILAGTNATAGSGASGYNPVRSLDQYQLMALKKLTQYARRHQLAGSRSLDRYLASFGITLEADKLERCYYLGSMNVPVDIGDVMSNSDTIDQGGAYLGAYAGKGFGYSDNGHFENRSNEYGMFIIMSSLVPQIGYVQGVDRHNYHLSRTDFWTPQFDALGNQAIDRSELLVSNAPGQWNGEIYNGIFGFNPRYAEYATSRDWLTGAFSLQSQNRSGDASDSWHLNRMFSYLSWNSDETKMVHNQAFVQGMETTQYDRIFYNQSATADHFYMLHRFRVHSSSPKRPLYDDALFDGEETRKVPMEVNGVRAN